MTVILATLFHVADLCHIHSEPISVATNFFVEVDRAKVILMCTDDNYNKKEQNDHIDDGDSDDYAFYERYINLVFRIYPWPCHCYM